MSRDNKYTDLPFSLACENNKATILSHLQQLFAKHQRVLEIGSGTGQHALYFAEHLPHLVWQASDQSQYLPTLTERIRRANLANLPLPLALDICADAAPVTRADALFTANTLHIMPWPVVQHFFSRLNELTQPEAILCIYGPFNYQGHFTSTSNQAFDLSLKTRDPAMGIRDHEQVLVLAQQQGFHLTHDHAMPANNRLLCFSKVR
ncbi:MULTISPECIES: DUF938 domain-containing protein [unclassified Alishewanella]|uniref:DUF938 domain-containing protein n=1 Tax=unclassified Alishewanella TaxID=2628974 RepID=UPI00276DCBF4|nr:class I SAM-dependent methyltransferase [Alishewanella sp.]